MTHVLLRSLNRIAWAYAYLGLPYALVFIYGVVVPAYREHAQLTNGSFVFFNLVFLYFFLHGYYNLIRTTFASVSACSTNAPSRSHHCYLCQACILTHDHHCFFVGTCIGEHNQRYFLLMLFHLLCAHAVGYAFVASYLWKEIGGFGLTSIGRILFFNLGYLLGFVETQWQAFICCHHYLVYFDVAFIGRLFYQILRRSLNGQTQYEEKKNIPGQPQSFSQIFGWNK